MNRIVRQSLHLLAALLLTMAWSVQAKIEPPDHVYYGVATLWGDPVPPGAVIEARSLPEGALLSRYTLGSNSKLGEHYKLPIPLDTVDPRKPGRARVGDPIRIFVNGLLAGEVSVGIDPGGGVRGIGSTTRLDLDPQNMGAGPAISIDDVSVVEGDSGTVDAVLGISLNAPADREIGIRWETRNGTAAGGSACGPGVDFVQRNETLTIPVGAQQGSIIVEVCGDEDPEQDEQFSVVLLSTVDNHGVFTTHSTGTVTILDDDNVPSVSIPDIRVARPAAGSTTARFIASLSRTHHNPVSFAWTTQNGTAVAGVDYQAANGTVTIEPGETHVELDVTVFAAVQPLPDKAFGIGLSNPVSLVIATGQAKAFLVDPRHDPAVREDGAVTGQDVPDLSKPSAIAVAPGGLHAYATSSDRNAVVRFDRDPASGALSNPTSYKADAQVRLKAAQDIVLSADGNFAYVVALEDNAVTVFSRDAASGDLGFVESIVQGGPVDGMQKPFRLAISPDDAQVYVLGRDSNAVVTFNRDASTGQLEFAGKIAKDAGGLSKLISPSGIAITPDGSQVFVTARSGNALLSFDREQDAGSADFGQLSQRAVQAAGPGGVAIGLNGAFGVAVSPDGKQVYVVAEQDRSVSTFNRAADGSLSPPSVIRQGDPGVYGLGGAQGVRVAPNGKEIFVTGYDDDSFSVFKRNANGSLTIHKTLFKGDNGLHHLSEPGAMATSADDRFVYVAASGGDSAIVVYRRLSEDDDTLFEDGFEED